MKDSLSNYGRAAKKYDNWLQTDAELENTGAAENAIENKAIELYREMLDDPELLAEALQESYSEDWALFAAALGDAIRREIPSWDIQYLRKITDAADDIIMDYAKKLAEQEWDEL